MYPFSVCIVYSKAFIEILLILYTFCNFFHEALKDSFVSTNKDEYRNLCLYVDGHGQVLMRIVLGLTVSDSRIYHQLNQ